MRGDAVTPDAEIDSSAFLGGLSSRQSRSPGRLIDRATILRFSGKPFRNPQGIHGAQLEDE